MRGRDSRATSGELQDGLRKVKSLTDRPFGANINLFPGTPPTDVHRFIETLHAEGVRVIETSGRNPKDHVARIKEAGRHQAQGRSLVRQA